jgi:hypothetical protein
VRSHWQTRVKCTSCTGCCLLGVMTKIGDVAERVFSLGSASRGWGRVAAGAESTMDDGDDGEEDTVRESCAGHAGREEQYSMDAPTRAVATSSVVSDTRAMSAHTDSRGRRLGDKSESGGGMSLRDFNVDAL